MKQETINQESNPRAYVSTFAKYNSGSLMGAWMDLTAYGNFADFVTACNALHSDETNPELMCLGFQSIPDGLTLSEDFGENDFTNIVKAWRGIKKGSGAKKPQKCVIPQAMDEYLAEIRKFSKDEDYYKKHTLPYLLPTGGIIQFRKPSIETQFCFGYGLQCQTTSEEAEAMADYARTNGGYFKSKNLSGAFISHLLARINCGERLLLYKAYQQDVNIYEATELTSYNEDMLTDEKYCAHEATEEELAYITAVLEQEKAAFEKRLDSYLKRYGTSKLHVWTYWADE